MLAVNYDPAVPGTDISVATLDGTAMPAFLTWP